MEASDNLIYLFVIKSIGGLSYWIVQCLVMQQ